jgi:hypothetical protein
MMTMLELVLVVTHAFLALPENAHKLYFGYTANLKLEVKLQSPV